MCPRRRTPPLRGAWIRVNRRSPPESCGEVPQHATAGVNPGDRFDPERRLTARHRNGDQTQLRHHVVLAGSEQAETEVRPSAPLPLSPTTGHQVRARGRESASAPHPAGPEAEAPQPQPERRRTGLAQAVSGPAHRIGQPGSRRQRRRTTASRKPAVPWTTTAMRTSPSWPRSPIKLKCEPCRLAGCC